MYGFSTPTRIPVVFGANDEKEKEKKSMFPDTLNFEKHKLNFVAFIYFSLISRLPNSNHSNQNLERLYIWGIVVCCLYALNRDDTV